MSTFCTAVLFIVVTSCTNTSINFDETGKLLNSFMLIIASLSYMLYLFYVFYVPLFIIIYIISCITLIGMLKRMVRLLNALLEEVMFNLLLFIIRSRLRKADHMPLYVIHTNVQ